MRTLITGIHGSGASYLAEFLSTLPNNKIYGITRWHTDRQSNLNNVKDKVELLECDLTDLGSVIRALEESTPHYIFHMASHANVRVSFINPISIFNNNVNGTLNLLEGLRILKQRPVVQFCGTSEVYGQVHKEDLPIKETHKIDPVNVYAISKLAQEKLCKSYWMSYGIPVVITRAFTYINPRRPDIFSSSFARQIVEIEKGKRKVLSHGNLESTRTIIDVRDIVRAYFKAATSCVTGEEYNVGGTEPITVNEFLGILISHAKCKIKKIQDTNLIRPVDVTMQVPDVSKFYNQTKWTSIYTLDDSIDFLLDYYRKIV